MRYTLKNFYQSDEWQAFRTTLMNERVNEKGELLCADCGKPILKAYDCIGHHKIRLTEENVNDANISLNPDNVDLIHFGCHNKEHRRGKGQTLQRVFLVYGSPCSGKNSFVNENANDDDLILDIDALYEAICLRGKYDKPNRIKMNVFGIRDCIMDQIRTRTGKWRNAWVIGGYPLRTDRDRICTLLNAEPIYIEASKEECLQRASNDRPEAWRGYIEDWFESYVP